jgi:glycerophosphoryl diester phosphodiesterase
MRPPGSVIMTLFAETSSSLETSWMPTRVPAQVIPPYAFAHRGARALAPENTLDAFTLALRLGATGLESDVWLTADGEAVLDHDGVVGGRLRRRAIGTLERNDLPDHIPTLDDLYANCGTQMQVSLDVKDPAAFDRVVAVARAAGGDALANLWLCHPRWEQVAEWRVRNETVHLVDSTRLDRIKEGPERRAADLAAAGIDALNMHHLDWTGGLTTLCHRFGVLAFGWDAQSPRVLAELIDAGIDGVYSDHVDRMVDAVGAAYPAAG